MACAKVARKAYLRRVIADTFLHLGICGSAITVIVALHRPLRHRLVDVTGLARLVLLMKSVSFIVSMKAFCRTARFSVGINLGAAMERTAFSGQG